MWSEKVYKIKFQKRQILSNSFVNVLLRAWLKIFLKSLKVNSNRIWIFDFEKKIGMICAYLGCL
ncbi:hypothetical protein FFZ99_06895 [Leptospira interrogans]|uniref:Uncharacterized protein n=2 Tax=Leptospira interrogans TaxID=173 RepID=A0AAP9WB56_LEPIR|nr:hypothetical protein A6J42_06305 [Leptospira interrogans serovar Copenhageni]ASP42561.1 hypothetical protein AMR47_16245 [Leptospira interrogans]ASV07280.1 hypothetical protein B2G47_17235 [Leptospira interrogans serovar Canicola]EMN71650.1 hypothetical protein LEP1GSC100_4837 [Leptospira interrogans serovar Bataviae str. UI 08561]KAA1269976.1 hypothetical protein C5473_17830 [Leptospira interrogans serovar Weerasinghe]KAA1287559.1 hypothetical protein C4X99_23875 [Leptospira interrogans se